MAALASHAAQAFQRAQLQAREALARRRLEALGELATGLSTALTRFEVVQIVLERGMKVMGADTCTIYSCDKEGGELGLIGDRGVSQPILDQIRTIHPDSGNPVWGRFDRAETLFVQTEAEYLALYPALAGQEAPGPRAPEHSGAFH